MVKAVPQKFCEHWLQTDVMITSECGKRSVSLLPLLVSLWQINGALIIAFEWKRKHWSSSENSERIAQVLVRVVSTSLM